jgi:Fe-S cluster biogenesis protein NfuA
MSEVTQNEKKLTAKEQAAYDDLVARINRTLNKLRPFIQADGGDVHFEGFEDGIVSVSMSGACAGCMAINTTLNDGIEALLIDEVPEVKGVRLLPADPFSYYF